jgi:hypothetical protein
MEALLVNMEGVCLLGYLRKNAYLDSFSWTQRTLKFKSGGHLELSKEQGSPEMLLDYGEQWAWL